MEEKKVLIPLDEYVTMHDMAIAGKKLVDVIIGQSVKRTYLREFGIGNDAVVMNAIKVLFPTEYEQMAERLNKEEGEEE